MGKAVDGRGQTWDGRVRSERSIFFAGIESGIESFLAFTLFFCYYTSFNIDAQDMKKQLIDHWVGMQPASSDGFV